MKKLISKKKIKKRQKEKILDNQQIYTAGYSDPVIVTAKKELTEEEQMQADAEWREYLKEHPIEIGSEEYNRLPEKAKAQVRKNNATDDSSVRRYTKRAGNVFKKLKNKVKYAKNFVKGKLNLYDPYIIDLSKENVSRITEDNHKESKSLLWNDFVENDQNSIRPAKDFINTDDNYIGDNNIPLSNISTYYGIEDGSLKAGDLSIFNPNTLVIPNRAKNIGKVQKIINNSNEKTSSDSPYLAITQSNDTVPFPINPSVSPKMVFADENGNAVFINNLRDDNIRDSLNTHLNNTPMYPILVDNGRYSSYYPEGEALDVYAGIIRNPNNMHIIGLKYKNGGTIKFNPFNKFV